MQKYIQEYFADSNKIADGSEHSQETFSLLLSAVAE
jgi:hypothetical protein